jgi:excisionase family DNA binding protein
VRKEQNEYEGRKYLTGAEAAALMGVHPRTLYRMIARGEIVASHTRSHKLRIAYDDVLAWRERQGLPPLSPTDSHESLISAIQELKEQIHQLRERVDSLLASFVAPATLRADTEAANSEHQQPSFDLRDLARIFASFRSSRTAKQSISVLERRGLPAGTTTVAAFAKQHQVKVNRIKKLCEENHIALTIIPRDSAVRNAREWWITPEQQEALLSYWQQRQIPYVVCQQCPHAVSLEAHAE